jgi:hypothetical protein
MLTVMGIIGYTHGVSEVRNPAVRAKRNAWAVPRAAASAKSPAAAENGSRKVARLERTNGHRAGGRRERSRGMGRTTGIYHGMDVRAVGLAGGTARFAEKERQ